MSNDAADLRKLLEQALEVVQDVKDQLSVEQRRTVQIIEQALSALDVKSEVRSREQLRQELINWVPVHLR